MMNIEFLIAPKNLGRLRVHAGGSVGSEVTVKSAVVDYGCGGSVAVQFVCPLGIFFSEDLEVMNQNSGSFVDTKGVEPYA